jgi:HNH endonuclease
VPFSIAGTESLKSTTIEPWRESQKHRFEDLIALCLNCHQMADRGEVDRKSLRLYKARLAAAFDWGSVVCSEEGSRHVTAYAEGAPEILVPFEAVAGHLAEDIPRCVGVEL